MYESSCKLQKNQRAVLKVSRSSPFLFPTKSETQTEAATRFHCNKIVTSWLKSLTNNETEELLRILS